MCGAIPKVGRIDGNLSSIYYGEYPQKEVTGALAIYLTNKYAKPLPLENGDSWFTNNYLGMAPTKSTSMWYKDIEWAGHKYRGVYFTEYRTTQHSHYVLNTVYWFEFAPIKWTMLDISVDGGSALIITDNIIDSQPYQTPVTAQGYNTNVGIPNNKVIYGNDWEWSTLRSWLVNRFMGVALNSAQQNAIIPQVVNIRRESASGPNGAGNYFSQIQNNTTDKIFMLTPIMINTYRSRIPGTSQTDYAVIQAPVMYGNDCLTCTPYYSDPGYATSFNGAMVPVDNPYGIRPVMMIRLF